MSYSLGKRVDELMIGHDMDQPRSIRAAALGLGAGAGNAEEW